MVENADGGAEMRRLPTNVGTPFFAPGKRDAGESMDFLMGTTVDTPLASLLMDAFEYARGLLPLTDVPAVVDRAVVRE